MKKDVLYAKFGRELFLGLDQFALLTEVRIKVKWVCEGGSKEARKILETEKLNEEECMIEYERRVNIGLNKVLD